MPKGKTNQPLTVWIAAAWRQHPAVTALVAAGHRIEALTTDVPLPLTEPDLILHPAAHNWSEPMFQEDEKKDGTKYRPYLEAAIAAARARKRGKK